MTQHTVTFGKRRVASVDFDLRVGAWRPYDHGKGRTEYWSGLRQYLNQELPCSCGGWAEVLALHQPVFEKYCDITIKHIPANHCRGCGHEGSFHYTVCSLVQVGDTLIEFGTEGVVGTLGKRESGEYYLIPIEAAS